MYNMKLKVSPRCQDILIGQKLYNYEIYSNRDHFCTHLTHSCGAVFIRQKLRAIKVNTETKDIHARHRIGHWLSTRSATAGRCMHDTVCKYTMYVVSLDCVRVYSTVFHKDYSFFVFISKA